MSRLALVLILGLAAYRGQRFLTRDSFTDDLRRWLYRWAWDDENPRPSRDDPNELEPSPRGPIKVYVYEGLTCPFCVGVWSSAVVWSLWRTGTDWARSLVTVIAAAGIAAIVVSRTGDA